MGNIAIIPARSGSKGLKDKNIIDLCGRPLMSYTVQAALESGMFDMVMVSTDSEYYAEIAQKCGAEVPFLRSREQSGDTSGSWDVVREVLAGYIEMGQLFEYVALLQPTSPLRNAEDIRGAFRYIQNGQAHSVVSVTEVEHPIQWCFRMHPDHFITDIAESPYRNARRQELEKHYRENGAIYIVHANMIRDPAYEFYADKCFGYFMPKDRSVDIDDRFDLTIAETLIRYAGKSAREMADAT